MMRHLSPSRRASVSSARSRENCSRTTSAGMKPGAPARAESPESDVVSSEAVITPPRAADRSPDPVRRPGAYDSFGIDRPGSGRGDRQEKEARHAECTGKEEGRTHADRPGDQRSRGGARHLPGAERARRPHRQGQHPRWLHEACEGPSGAGCGGKGRTSARSRGSGHHTWIGFGMGQPAGSELPDGCRRHESHSGIPDAR